MPGGLMLPWSGRIWRRPKDWHAPGKMRVKPDCSSGSNMLMPERSWKPPLMKRQRACFWNWVLMRMPRRKPCNAGTNWLWPPWQPGIMSGRRKTCARPQAMGMPCSSWMPAGTPWQSRRKPAENWTKLSLFSGNWETIGMPGIGRPPLQ